jgi:hypothetical protein
VARVDEPGGDDLATTLDEELGRLPTKYRAPVVLCYLEGLTHEEAAHQLDWPIGSVKGRLARAKEMLRGRLARRGVLPTAGLLASTMDRNASAAVPASLRHATVQAALQFSAGRAAAGLVSRSVVRLMEGVLSAMFVTKLKVTAAILGTCGCLALGAWALGQPSRGDKPGSDDARAVAKEPDTASPPRDQAADLAARDQALRDALEKPIDLTLRGARLEDMLKSIRKETQSDGSHGVPIYVDPDGLKEAGATVDYPVTIDARKVPLKSALEWALRPLKLAATTRDGLLIISSRQDVSLIELQALNEQLRRMNRKPEAATEPAGPEGLSPAAWLKRMQGHRTAFSPDYDDEANPEDEAKTRAILAALKKRIPMPFAEETPLEDVLAYIAKETQGQDLPDGIPIYVDPVGLNEAEKTMQSPVTLDLKGVALRESLRLILKQLGLLYTVKDGLLSITSTSSDDSPTPILSLADKAALGELSLREMNDLVELFKARELVRRYAAGTPDQEVMGRPKGPDGGAFGTTNPEPPPAAAGEDPKTKLILAALEKVVPLHLKESTIEDAVKAIRQATAGPGLPEGIPIYFNPRAFRFPGQEKTTVTLDLDDVKLKTSLRLMLGQVGLAYTVKEGLMIIDNPDSPEIAPRGKGEAGGMGAGGGGGGGGFR